MSDSEDENKDSPIIVGIIGFLFLAILIFIVYKTFFGDNDDMER